MKLEGQTTILLADDSETFLMYAGILVKRLGFKTYLARDGVEALKIAKEKKPSIIVLDYMMPKIDGTSCLNIIRSDKEISSTPVIVLTSYGSDAVREEFEKLGCCYFMGKPVNITELQKAIRGCLKIDNIIVDKRKQIRTALKLKVMIECQGEKRELYATSLSEEGLFLRTVAPFNAGTEMEIFLNIDDEDPLELRGQVVYVNRLSTEIEPEPGMGIKLIEVPQDVKYRINDFIMKELTDDLTIEDENFLDREAGLENS